MELDCEKGRIEFGKGAKISFTRDFKNKTTTLFAGVSASAGAVGGKLEFDMTTDGERVVNAGVNSEIEVGASLSSVKAGGQFTLLAGARTYAGGSIMPGMGFQVD